jgi:hypothetical protein
MKSSWPRTLLMGKNDTNQQKQYNSARLFLVLTYYKIFFFLKKSTVIVTVFHENCDIFVKNNTTWKKNGDIFIKMTQLGKKVPNLSLVLKGL